MSDKHQIVPEMNDYKANAEQNIKLLNGTPQFHEKQSPQTISARVD